MIGWEKMFKHLQEIDIKLYERYLTVEKNIKSASNSFYDAYLDLQEEFVKMVASVFDCQIVGRETCGDLLKKEDVKQAFLSILNVDNHVFDKMQDYTLKVNAHKHKREKNIQIDTIVNYMRIVFDVTTAFATYKNIEAEGFEANYFVEMFGEYEKENASLKLEMNKLRGELSASVESGKLKDCDILAYKSLVSQTEIEKLGLEDQNRVLHKQISKLKDIKLSSMEEKLNRTIDLLNQLTESVVENRAISYAVGDTICGADRFKTYVAKAKEDLRNE